MDNRNAAKRERAAPEASGAASNVDTGGSGSSRYAPVVLTSMSTPVSPPRKRQRAGAESNGDEAAMTERAPAPSHPSPPEAAPIRSPFQLTAIRDLPASANVDAVTVRDVFGDPHLVECWEFNYLHDLDFLMAAFDDGARERGIAVHVVHGLWQQEDPRRQRLETAAHRINNNIRSGKTNNITLHTAFMPEPFGTHHTKMAVLFRDDDTAQVIVHTANLIPHDWGNMTQAVWRSPLLPLLLGGGAESKGQDSAVGRRFKHDLLGYLRSYNRRRPVCQPLVTKLAKYDFSAVRAVLIGSVPGRYPVLRQDPRDGDSDSDGDTAEIPWGWAAMKDALKHVPLRDPSPGATGKASTAEIVMQVSSIATLGGNDSWLRHTLFAAFSGGKAKAPEATKTPTQPSSFGPLRWAAPASSRQHPKPQFRIVFPVADEIRRSLDGYVSGTSIHTKIQSIQQQRQLDYTRPLLCHWANDVDDGEPVPESSGANRCHGDAGRRRAAPHVKTYVRYSGPAATGDADADIDWALLTSANLSKQAWGEAQTMGGEMRIASYELGVLVWPALLAEGATMRPVFGRDVFGEDAPPTAPVVPLRIPYGLPLQRYAKHEVPWVGTMAHDEPDWRGMRWQDV